MSHQSDEPLLRGRMILCPWCEKWQPLESFIQLQLPSAHITQVSAIYKCVQHGCKRLFALSERT